MKLTRRQKIIGGSILAAALAGGAYLYFRSDIPAAVKAKIEKLPKLKQIAEKLSIPPFWLWYIIQKESGWNPKAFNPNGGATGLIQFMPSTAKGLGTSTAKLLTMNIDQQLDYVYKYFLPYKGKMKSIADLYMITFYPLAMSKPSNYILGSEKGIDYAKLVTKQNNPKFDRNKNSLITKSEFRKAVTEDARKKYGYNPVKDLIKI